jgi:hypothetical protein
MSAAEKDRRTLMLVEDPRKTIETICDVDNRFFTWQSFKVLYEKKIGRLDNPVSKGTADTHFYILTQLNLLAPVQEKSNQYTLSNLGKAICQKLNENNVQEYQRYLRNLLLSNESKGPLFQEFIKFIEERAERGNINRGELAQQFKPDTTLRSLISWSIEAQLIEYDKDKDLIWLLKLDSRTVLSLENFWLKLKELYKSLQKTEIFLINNVFVEIAEIRADFCMKENLTLDDFDSRLTDLLNSQYGRRIRLYGGPSSVYEGKRNFLYKGKAYVYIRLKV